jgi:hydrogenase maturation protease
MNGRRVLVAGWGHSLRGDDAAGWRVAQDVRKRWGERVEILSGAQPLPEWTEALARADVAYFVDASVDSAITRFQASDLAPALRSVTSASHALDGASLLRLALDLYGRAPPTSLLLLPAESFDVGERLSPRTAAAIEEAVNWLDRQLLAQLAVPACTR